MSRAHRICRVIRYPLEARVPVRLTLPAVLAARRVVLLLASLGLGACGGDPTQPAPPPPPPPPPSVVVAITPATATVEMGATQAFTAQVANSSTTAAVTWTSTGGTITGTGNTVTWTAPATAGAYTLTAASLADPAKKASASITVPPPPSVVVVLDNAPVGTGGGTLTVNQPTSPLHGMSILIPAGTYPTATAWSVAELRDAKPTLPPALRQIGPTLRIGNGQGFADEPFFLTIPVALGPDSVAGAAFWDPASGTLEPLPVVHRTATSLMIMTQHVSADHMLIPATGALYATGGLPQGQIQVVLLTAWRGNLVTQLTTSFVPGQDDWEFANYGSATVPGGYCTGSTLTALYYHYVLSAQHGRLYARYDEFDPLGDDNPHGIRLASVVQETMNWPANTTRIGRIQQALGISGGTLGGATWARTQLENLALAILTTGRAQQLAIYTQAWTRGHAIIAYRMNLASYVDVADPNYPSIHKQIHFTATQVTPFDFADRAGAATLPYSEILMLGVSALVPMPQMASHWNSFFAGTIGDQHFPSAITEYRDPVGSVWREAIDPIITTSDQLAFRSRCPDCPLHGDLVDVPLPSDGRIRLFDDKGLLLASDEGGTEASLSVPDEATYRHGVTDLTAPVGSVSGNTPSFINFRWLDVTRVPFTLEWSPQDAEGGDLVTFTVENGGIGATGDQYRWTVGTDAPVFTPFSVGSLQRVMPAEGITVVVELIDPQGHTRARAEASTTLLPRFHGLGTPGSSVMRLSRDGSVVLIGGSFAPVRRWTAAAGVTQLGFVANFLDASDDATVLVGSDGARPLRWTAANGVQTLATSGVAWGISGDGNVVVGETGGVFTGTDITPRRAFRWTAAGGFVDLGIIGIPSGGTSGSSQALAASLDGSVVVGVTSSGSSFSEAFRTSGVLTGLGSLGVLTGAQFPYSAAHDVSDDGSVVVGVTSVPTGYQVFRWNGGMQPLGPIGGSPPGAPQVSGDGSTIIFTAGNPLTGFIWTAAMGVVDVATALQSNFGIDLGGWTITGVTAISRDGRVLVGRGINPDGVIEAWRAVIR